MNGRKEHRKYKRTHTTQHKHSHRQTVRQAGTSERTFACCFKKEVDEKATTMIILHIFLWSHSNVRERVSETIKH